MLAISVILNIIVSFLVSLFISIGIFGGIFINVSFILFFGVHFLFFYSIAYFLAFIMQYVLGGKMIMLQRKGIKEKCALTIQDNIIIDYNGEIKTEYLWKNIKTIHNAKSNIMIFISDLMAIIIPKRIFNSKDELNNCWDYIQNCYNNSHNAV